MSISSIEYEKIYRSVDCSKCGRRAGERCYTVRAKSEAGYNFTSPQPHKARVNAYRKLNG